MHLRTIKAGDGAILKSVTLRSVVDSPYAFGGVETLEEERKRPDAQWEELAAECGGEVEAWRDRCVGYFFGWGCGVREGAGVSLRQGGGAGAYERGVSGSAVSAARAGAANGRGGSRVGGVQRGGTDAVVGG
jgi:hypothetical protein